MIRVQLMQGPQAGYQVTLTDPVIRFGRSPENQIAINEAHLSRHHGDLTFTDGHWVLTCHSANGCTVNGKKVKEGQTRALAPGDVVGVGKHKVFAVNYTPTEAAEGHHDEASAIEDTGPKMSRRSKLWISIGVYIGVVMVIGIVLMAIGKPQKGGSQGAPQLADDQIASEIRKGLQRPLDEREAERHLNEARREYTLIESRPDALFNTHFNYKLALAHSKKDSFEGIDQLQFSEVEQRLIDKVTTQYTNAYAMMRKQQWRSAKQAFQELISNYRYRSDDSVIYNNVAAQLKAIEPHTRRRSFGR